MLWVRYYAAAIPSPSSGIRTFGPSKIQVDPNPTASNMLVSPRSSNLGQESD